MSAVNAVSTSSRTRSLALCGLSIALIAVSAWVTIPLGSVPFTLQVFAVTLVLLVLEPRYALATIALYLCMGALGLPVFSSMRGGFGVLLGPTGGFLWGYLVGGTLAMFVRCALGRLIVNNKRTSSLREGNLSTLWSLSARSSGGLQSVPLVVDIATAGTFLVVVYLFGWIQLALVSGMGLVPALVAGVLPFVLLDCAKVAGALVVARAIRRAVR